MGKIFGYDSRFMNCLSKIADVFLLNVLFIITSISIVTIGASMSALYSVMLKVAADEEGHIIKSYFQTFGEKFNRATCIWLILLVFGVILGLDVYFYVFSAGNQAIFLIKYLFYVLFICYIFIFSYVFVVLVKFDGRIKKTLIESFFMSVRHLPYTLIIVFFNLLSVILVLGFPMILPYVILIEIFIGFSGIAYINSCLFNRVFELYDKEIDMY